MRKLFTILCSVICISGYSQGIKFEEGSWNEILKKAKQENRPIFVDVYTSWCGPCKKMSSTIFPMEKVGSYFNSNFICVKFDAEKGDGILIKHTYRINCYPTYLFIRPNGEVFYSNSSSSDASTFISKGKDAMKLYKDSSLNNKLSIAQFKEYDIDKQYSILLNLDKRNLTLQPYFDSYLMALPKEQRLDSKNKKLFKAELLMVNANTFAYKIISEDIERSRQVLSAYDIDFFLSIGISNTFNMAAYQKDTSLLYAMINNCKNIPYGQLEFFMDELEYLYYYETAQYDKYKELTLRFANSTLLNLNDSDYERMDNAFLKKACFKGSEQNFIKTQGMLKSAKTSYAKSRIANKLSLIVNHLGAIYKDSATINNLLVITKKVEELCPQDPMAKRLYPRLMYQIGNKELAITKEQEIYAGIDINDTKNRNEIESEINTMRAGGALTKE